MANIGNQMRRAGEDYGLFTACSNIDGAIVGVLWILSFLCFVGEFQAPSLSLAAMALSIGSLAMLAIRMRRFRDTRLGGVMSFGKAMVYSLQCFFKATILMAVAQYVYFQFFDRGYLMNQYVAMLSVPDYAAVVKQTYGMDAKQIIAILQATVGQLRPIEIAFQFLTVNIVLSLFLSLPLAAVTRRK